MFVAAWKNGVLCLRIWHDLQSVGHVRKLSQEPRGNVCLTTLKNFNNLPVSLYNCESHAWIRNQNIAITPLHFLPYQLLKTIAHAHHLHWWGHEPSVNIWSCLRVFAAVCKKTGHHRGDSEKSRYTGCLWVFLSCLFASFLRVWNSLLVYYICGSYYVCKKYSTGMVMYM